MHKTKSTNSSKAFTWSETDEPHATRRKLILKKYPKIKELFRNELLTFPISVSIVLLQFAMACWAQNLGWISFFIMAYVIGGTANHSLQLAIHEITHNLCFENHIANRLLGIFCNLSTAIPSAISFQKYHMEHHRFQGVDGIDADIPSLFEVQIFTNAFLKAIWMLFQPFFYALRPLLVRPKPITQWEVLNLFIVFGSDYLIYHFIGGKALAYLILGTLLGMGLHPCAGHFIAEHYMLTNNQETYSYYGICNWFNFNVGYHNEHHDFPRIPWSYLPKVREYAPEFYQIPSYNSYISVIWRYITDPSIGPWSRIKRSPAFLNKSS